MRITLSIAIALVAIAGLGYFIHSPEPDRTPIPIRGDPRPEPARFSPSVPKVSSEHRAPDPQPLDPSTIEVVQRGLAGLVRAWEEGDDAALGSILDQLIEISIANPDSILQTARQLPSLAERVFALEIALRAALFQRDPSFLVA